MLVSGRAGWFKCLAILVASVQLSACATLFHGSNQTVTFDSSPEGARVKVGPYTGVTPYTIAMPKSKDYPVEFSKDGYQSSTVPLEKSFDGIGALNILFWPGFIIDLAAGSMFKYDPETYTAQLTPVAQASAASLGSSK